MRKKKQKIPRPPVCAGPAALEFLEPGAPLSRLYQGLLILLFLLLTLLAIRQVGSPDAGFHLKAGDFILTGHGWPDTDSFTYTLNNRHYLDTSWGYQVLLTLAHRAGGAPGMVIFHWIILAALFFLIYKTARLSSVDPATLFALMGAGILACEIRYDIRPELLSYLFFAAVLYAVHRHAFGLKTPLWVLPLLLWLWANCHALFVLGWAVLACAIVGLWWRDHRPDKPLLLWTLASFLAPLVNPYGLRGVLFPFTLLTRFQSGNIFAQTVGEFSSPFAIRTSPETPYYPWLPIWTFRIVAVLLPAAVVVLLRRRTYWAALLGLIFIPLGAKMVRNIPVMLIAALPVMVWALPVSELWRRLRWPARRARFARNALLAAMALSAVGLGLRVRTNAYYLSTLRPDRFGWGWNRAVLPVDAAQYVKRTGLPGRMLNDFCFGGYLMWALPQPVFADDRLELAGEEFYKGFQEIFSSSEALERAAARYGIQWIILPHTQEPAAVARLSTDPRWRLAYLDRVAVIFIREGSNAPGWVDRDSVERLAPQTPDLTGLPGLGGPPRRSPLMRWLSGLVKPQHYPMEEFNTAVFHYYRDEYSLAEAWLRAALMAGGEAYNDIYLNLGITLAQEKNYSGAALCYRAVLRDEPGNTTAAGRMAALVSAGRAPW